MSIQQLDTIKKILLTEQLGESVRAEVENSDLTPAQRRELERRLAAFEIDQDLGADWDAVRNRILAVMYVQRELTRWHSRD